MRQKKTEINTRFDGAVVDIYGFNYLIGKVCNYYKSDINYRKYHA